MKIYHLFFLDAWIFGRIDEDDRLESYYKILQQIILQLKNKNILITTKNNINQNKI